MHSFTDTAHTVCKQQASLLVIEIFAGLKSIPTLICCSHIDFQCSQQHDV